MLVAIVVGIRFGPRLLARMSGGGATPSSTVGDPTSTDANTAASPMAGTIMGQCTAPGAATESCVGNALEGALRTNGQRAAFTLLARMSISPALEGKVYRISQQLGRAAFQVSGPSKALADCPKELGSGCSHGVIEQLFAARGPTADMTKLCAPPTQKTRQALLRCWQSVGIGLYMANGRDWKLSTKQCTPIVDVVARAACTTGVFAGGGLDDDTDESGKPFASLAAVQSPSARRARAEFLAHVADPVYPCNGITDRDLASSCWRAEPQTAVRIAKGAFSRAFSVCAGAGVYRPICEEGTGTAAVVRVAASGKSPLALCDAVPRSEASWRRCMTGALGETMTKAESIAPGLALCSAVESDATHDCYSTIGIVHLEIEPRADARRTACSSAPEAYRDLCGGDTRKGSPSG